MDHEQVLRFLHRKQANGHACALVVVGAVEGSSMRNPGTIMGVADDGGFAGSLSGGCIEDAVVAEAIDVIKTGEPRCVRFGLGSQYLDIRLPCGGGLDLRFVTLIDDQLVTACIEQIDARAPFSIELNQTGVHCRKEWQNAHYNPTIGTGVFGYWPVPRLAIIGHGASVAALANMAKPMGCDVAVLSPDRRVESQLDGTQIGFTLLDRISDVTALSSDRWSAIIFLFHDHDWESELLVRAFQLPRFFLGAMGGRIAHEQRCKALRQRGISQAQIEQMHAPIGLFHSSRDPQTLALSTLAQVIRSYEQANFEGDLA